jgi:hypothetical protein
MGGGFSVKNKRVLSALDAFGVLIVGTRLTLFLSVVIAFMTFLRLASHHGHLAILIYLLTGVACTVYCSGRLLERLWLVSGTVSTKLWKKSQPMEELSHG